MKIATTTLGTFGFLSSIVLAGTVASSVVTPAPTACSDGFAQARRPISNPTLFDLALPTTNVHAIAIFHGLPDRINYGGKNIALGGDAQVYAIQFEYALNDRLSIVATKDGYVDLDFDNTLADQSGFANLAAGVKYAFILDPASRTAVSGTATVEVPTGNRDVLQGEYDGLVNLSLNGLKLVNDWQFAGTAGVQIPFNDDQAMSSYISAHVSYDLCKYFIPMVELNWFHVISEGEGGQLINPDFEGGDFFNLGSTNSSTNRDFVTAAFGFRSRLTDCVDVGAAYEIPLTDEEDGLMDDRITLDLVWKF